MVVDDDDDDDVDDDDDDDALMVVNFVSLLICRHLGLESGNLCFALSGFGNPKRCAMKDFLQPVSLRAWHLKNAFASRSVNKF